MLCIVSPLIFSELIFAAFYSIVAVYTHTCGRIPRSSENCSTKSLRTFGGRDCPCPCTAVITAINSQDSKTKLVLAVTESLLNLSIGHIALRNPFREVYTAESSDSLICGSSINRNDISGSGINCRNH